MARGITDALIPAEVQGLWAFRTLFPSVTERLRVKDRREKMMMGAQPSQGHGPREAGDGVLATPEGLTEEAAVSTCSGLTKHSQGGDERERHSRQRE